MTDGAFSWWLFKAKLKHRIGIHSMIPTEEWNREQGSVRYVGLRCWLCDAGS